MQNRTLLCPIIGMIKNVMLTVTELSTSDACMLQNVSYHNDERLSTVSAVNSELGNGGEMFPNLGGDEMR